MSLNQRPLSSAFVHQALLLRPIHSNLPGVENYFLSARANLKDVWFGFLGSSSVQNLLANVKVHWWLFVVGRKRKHQQYAEALEVLQKVIALQPHRALVCVQAGYCLAKLNRHEEALCSYERAVQVAPNYGEAHAYMGLAYCELGRNREALESLNRAIRMKPSLKKDPYWLHMLGLEERSASVMTHKREIPDYNASR